jgi:hypothetical protein
MSARWIKLRGGDWGVKIEGTSVRVGDEVAVTRASGALDRVLVRSIIWERAGVQLVLASRRKKAEVQRARSPA